MWRAAVLICLGCAGGSALAPLPGAEPSAGGKGFAMDYGPFLSYTINGRNYSSNGFDNLALKGVAIRLEDPKAQHPGGPHAPAGAVCFDTELLRYAAAWTGGFLDISNTHLTSYKGSREAFIVGALQHTTRAVPGWSSGDDFADPRAMPAGPLPRAWARWKGLYRHQNKVVLYYTVDGADVLDAPGLELIDDMAVFVRAIEIQPTLRQLSVLVCDVEPSSREIKLGGALGAVGTNAVFATITGGPSGAELLLRDNRVVLRLPPIEKPAALTLRLWRQSSTNGAPRALVELSRGMPAAESGASHSLRGQLYGPPLWPEPIVTRGRRGIGRGAYVVDTLPVPEQNLWRSWIRLVALDFFEDGRAAVSTWNGDVWLVSGIDEGLQQVKWKRFAAGLHEPLGLKIVKGIIHVLGRDGITRLRDLNGDDEADYYENFNNEVPISPSYHAFAMDLDTDRAGNFYHTRCGQRIDPALPLNGGMVRISPDGSKAELLATGLRAANGLCVGPNDELVCSDNQGNWTPASRINWIKPGGFYGYTPHARLPVVPTDYEKPICWIPVFVDNSSGSQAWVTDKRWGPLQGKMLHTSYGKSALFLLMTEQVAGQWQGGVYQFPLKFDSGIMRARFNPQDGQLYLCGLKGWQTTGARDGALHRVRYTGAALRMPSDLHVKPEGIEIVFTTALERAAATDQENWAVQHWNYRWTDKYGSDDYSVEQPEKKGRDALELTTIDLSPDGRRVLLKAPKMQPVMQMRIQFRLQAQDGEAIAGEIYNTINRIPKAAGLTRR